MAAQNNKEQINFSFKGIDLVNFSLNRLEQPLSGEFNFGFDINIQQHVFPEQKLLTIITKVDINLNQPQKANCATLTASCNFEVENLQDHLLEDNKQVMLPDIIMTTFNSISISTVRGLLFGELRGTYLHNVILPIIDPKQLVKSTI